MKTLSVLMTGLLLIAGPILFAAGETNGDAGKSIHPQLIMNQAACDPDVIVFTGKILEAGDLEPIRNAVINFTRLGDELVNGSIDAKGNYALALKKSEMGEPVRLIIRVNGYKKFIAKNIDKNQSIIDMDIVLERESNEPTPAKRAFKLNEDPFNAFVIKMNN